MPRWRLASHSATSSPPSSPSSPLDLFLRLISAINRRPFVPTPSPVPAHRPHADCGSVMPRRRALPDNHAPLPRTRARLSSAEDARAPQRPGRGRPAGGGEVGGGCDRLAMVRTMVAVCLLERVPFTVIDSAALLRKLEGDQSSATPAEKAALNELGGEDGTISAVERALPSLTEVWTWGVAPAAKAQVVGWPPIRSYRKNTMAANPPKTGDDAEGKQGSGCLYVKVSMDGAPYLRKVDLKMYNNYKELSSALENMFSCHHNYKMVIGCLLVMFHGRHLWIYLRPFCRLNSTGTESTPMDNS